MKSYIRGYSLNCSLGNDDLTIIKKIKTINQDNYERYLTEAFKEKTYYKIYDTFSSQKDRFEKIVKDVIEDCVKKTNLTKEEQKDLAIFIGSTSMGVSINEEINALYKIGESNFEFNHLEYGSIGTYVEDILESNHKAILFSTACTSSANAFCYASKLIEKKQINRAIVIGIELFNHTTFDGFSSLMLLSEQNIYHPFDTRSDGIILGEGCSAIILDSTPSSENDFYYVASKNVCDTYSETSSNPNGIANFESMNQALNNAKLTLKDIDFIKAHAAGSQNSNSSEANALSLLFKEQQHKVPITIIKPFIGHTLGACGTNEIVFILMCLHNNFIPPTLGCEDKIDELESCPIPKSILIQNKRISVLFNFVAFGGNNTSIILSNKKDLK